MNNKKSNNNQLLMTLLKGRTFIVLVLLVIFFTIVKGTTFLSASTLTMVAKHVALYGILALGMTFVIITGGIDLSVGSVVGLVGMLAGGMIQEGITLKFAGVTLLLQRSGLIIITMLVVGCIIGAVNGLIVTKLGVHHLSLPLVPCISAVVLQTFVPTVQHSPTSKVMTDLATQASKSLEAILPAFLPVFTFSQCLQLFPLSS